LWDKFDKFLNHKWSKSFKYRIKDLIIDKSSCFDKEFSDFWKSASSIVIGIGCQALVKFF